MRADSQLAVALAKGGNLTGRVAATDEEAIDIQSLDGPRFLLRAVARYTAIAAAIALFIGWLGFFEGAQQAVPTLVDRPMVRNIGPAGRASDPRIGYDNSQPAEESVEAMAAGENAEKQRKFCVDLPYINGGGAENANCVQRAFAFPAPGQRNIIWWPESSRLDNSPPPVSTARLPNEK